MFIGQDAWSKRSHLPQINRSSKLFRVAEREHFFFMEQLLLSITRIIIMVKPSFQQLLRMAIFLVLNWENICIFSAPYLPSLPSLPSLPTLPSLPSPVPSAQLANWQKTAKLLIRLNDQLWQQCQTLLPFPHSNWIKEYVLILGQL